MGHDRRRVGGRRGAAAVALVVMGSLWAGCSREEPGGCAFWTRKLTDEGQAQVAVKELVAKNCTEARGALAKAFDDSSVKADILAALVGWERSPEAESVVVKALAFDATQALAAKTAGEWALASAVAPLRARLAEDPGGAACGAGLEALLALEGATACAAEVVACLEAKDSGSRSRALGALSAVDWDQNKASVKSARAAVARRVLAKGAAVTASERTLAMRALAAIPGRGLEGLEAVASRAAAGDRMASYLLFGLAPKALARRQWRRLLAAEAASPRPEEVWMMTAELPSDLAPVLERLAKPDRAGWLGAAAWVVGERVRPLLEGLWEKARGEQRAAAAQALTVLLSDEALKAWEARLKGQASVLLRELPEAPEVAGIVALTRRCGTETGCYLKRLEEESVPRMAGLAVDVTKSQKALAEAQGDSAAASEALQTEAQRVADQGKGAAEALKRLQAEHAKGYAALDEASARVARGRGEAAAIVLALQRAMAGAGPRGRRIKVALALLEAAPLEVLPEIATAALSALRGQAQASDVATLTAAAARIEPAQPMVALWLAQLGRRIRTP